MDEIKGYVLDVPGDWGAIVHLGPRAGNCSTADPIRPFDMDLISPGE